MRTVHQDNVLWHMDMDEYLEGTVVVTQQVLGSEDYITGMWSLDPRAVFSVLGDDTIVTARGYEGCAWARTMPGTLVNMYGLDSIIIDPAMDAHPAAAEIDAALRAYAHAYRHQVDPLGVPARPEFLPRWLTGAEGMVEERLSPICDYWRRGQVDTALKAIDVMKEDLSFRGAKKEDASYVYDLMYAISVHEGDMPLHERYGWADLFLAVKNRDTRRACAALDGLPEYSS